MSSETATGMCLWPLWTPKVRPTNCGRMVERRLHILITSLRPPSRTLSAFLRRKPSMNGPFQTERVTSDYLSLALALMTRAQDELVGRLVGPRLLALGRLAPGGHRVAAARGAAFAAAMGMVDRVHGDAAIVRALAEPDLAARLAEIDVGV